MSVFDFVMRSQRRPCLRQCDCHTSDPLPLPSSLQSFSPMVCPLRQPPTLNDFMPNHKRFSEPKTQKNRLPATNANIRTSHWVSIAQHDRLTEHDKTLRDWKFVPTCRIMAICIGAWTRSTAQHWIPNPYAPDDRASPHVIFPHRPDTADRCTKCVTRTITNDCIDFLAKESES